MYLLHEDGKLDIGDWRTPKYVLVNQKSIIIITSLHLWLQHIQEINVSQCAKKQNKQKNN